MMRRRRAFGHQEKNESSLALTVTLARSRVDFNYLGTRAVFQAHDSPRIYELIIYCIAAQMNVSRKNALLEANQEANDACLAGCSPLTNASNHRNNHSSNRRECHPRSPFCNHL